MIEGTGIIFSLSSYFWIGLLWRYRLETRDDFLSFSFKKQFKAHTFLSSGERESFQLCCIKSESEKRKRRENEDCGKEAGKGRLRRRFWWWCILSSLDCCLILSIPPFLFREELIRQAFRWSPGEEEMMVLCCWSRKRRRWRRKFFLLSWNCSPILSWWREFAVSFLCCFSLLLFHLLCLLLQRWWKIWVM